MLLSRGLAVLHLNAAAEALLGTSATRARLTAASSLPRVGESLAALARRALSDNTPAEVDLELGPGLRSVARAAPFGRGVVIALSTPVEQIDLQSLAAGLAHEIKNPLAGLKGAAELLRDELPPEQAGYAELIAREAARVDRLVQSLLDLTRPPTLRLQPVNVHAVIDHVIALAAPRALTVERRFDVSLPEIEADPDALTQVLLNLLKNAVEAMAGCEGAIAIETAVAPGMKVRRDGRVRRVCRVTVVDRGPGLDPAVQPFTPFSTSKPRGTGLGLAIARRITEAHGGRLQLRDRTGGGAEAELLLPI